MIQNKYNKIDDFTDINTLIKITTKYNSDKIIEIITIYINNYLKKYDITKNNIINDFNNIFKTIIIDVQIKSKYIFMFIKFAVIIKYIIKLKKEDNILFLNKFIEIAGINWIKFAFRESIKYDTKLTIDIMNKYGILLYYETRFLIKNNIIADFTFNSISQYFTPIKNKVDYNILITFISIYGILCKPFYKNIYDLLWTNITEFDCISINVYGILYKMKYSTNKRILIFGKY
jgi:hypothetical protein